MELVYLWIEKYKNIENQEFNFSPRFICKYNKETNDLTIEENRDYISIFPDNINVTAIVGENGSGKSKLLNCFSNDEYSKDKKFLYFKNDSIYSIHKEGYIKFNVTNNTKYTLKEKKLDSQENFFLAFNLCNNLNGYTRSGDYIKYYDINEKESKRDLLKYFFVEKNEIHLNILPFYFYPDSLSININEEYLNEIHNYFLNDSFSEFIKKELLSAYYEKKYFLNDEIVLLLFYIKEFIELNKNKLQRHKDFYWDFIDICKKTLMDKYNSHDMSIKEALSNIKNYDNKLQNPNEDFLKVSKYLKSEHFYLIDKLKKDEIFDLVLKKKYFPLFEIDLADKDKNRTFFSLSRGEKFLYSFFIKIFKEVYSSKNNIVLFIDEFENYLHPNWQKGIVSLLIYFLNKNFKNKQIHIIMTSHSPFIVSDLPKENILFLEKGEQKYPFKKDEQTFGANIHTLLSHGFFMQDGLMGDFAKEKIEKIKKFYEIVKKYEDTNEFCINIKPILKSYFVRRQKKFIYIQSIIGEPFLQTIIKNYLDELEIIFNGKKQFLQNEIKRLQELESTLK